MTQQTATPIIALEGVTKRFPGVVANDSVDLEIRAGEVCVLLGENGAGKSTLIGLLSGLQQPDAGRILVDGRPTAIRSPSHALSLGIGVVFQHNMLVPSLTVAENLALGGAWWRRPDIAGLEARAAEIARSLGVAINLSARASELSLGEQQQVEIVRALLRDSRLLILDEATSMLTPQGAAELGALMRRLVGRGLAVVFITHKLGEAADFGDRVCVLKLGRKVGEIPPERLRTLERGALVDEIVALMFGRHAGDDAVSIPARAADDEALLDVRDLSLPAAGDAPALEAISFAIARGEILGVAGIDGNGQKQLAEALTGQRKATGDVRLAGEPLAALDIGGRRARGLRYLTDDRLGEGTVGAFPVSINLFLKQIGEPPLWRAGVERPREIDRRRDDPCRPAVGRQYPEGADRPRTRGRRASGDLQQADLRPRPRQHAGDASAHPRDRRKGHGGVADLHRPGGAAVDVPPHRRDCAGPAGWRRGERRGRRGAGRPVDDWTGGMSDNAASVGDPALGLASGLPPRSDLGRRLAVTLGPFVISLVVSGCVLMAVGVNPLTYYGLVVERGLLSPLGLQQTLTRMAPLLFIAAGLIVAFRAGLWNLGGDGQFLLGAVAAAASAPLLVHALPGWLALTVSLALAVVVAMVWSLVPALLRAYQGVNEIITTLMMSFLGVSLANALVKLAFLDPDTTVPQTRTLPVADRLPRLFETTVTSGLVFGLVAIVVVHLVMMRTAFGLKLRIVGANPRAAAHAGLDVPWLTIATFAISSGLIGAGGAIDILGAEGNVRAEWNPAYGLVVIPAVFLARMNGYASIGFVFLLSVLSIGGESAARRLGVPQEFKLVLVASVLITLALAEYLDHRLNQARRL
jgi:ABC-type uncharacterized transport system ATPase subunit/ABC-type uncharacterized transport system permease subunit